MSLAEAFVALKADLLGEGGPKISTMRNYRFAIVPYKPQEEYDLRSQVQRLTDQLTECGWHVLAIDMNQLLLARLRALGDETLQSIIDRERRLSARGGDTRALDYLAEKISPHIEGADGIAADVIAEIQRFLAAKKAAGTDPTDTTLVLIGRLGALYPFFRTSALLRHIDGKTNNVPVVLLYPGDRLEGNALSFMGELAPDRDYRPRIYP